MLINKIWKDLNRHTYWQDMKKGSKIYLVLVKNWTKIEKYSFNYTVLYLILANIYCKWHMMSIFITFIRFFFSFKVKKKGIKTKQKKVKCGKWHKLVWWYAYTHTHRVSIPAYTWTYPYKLTPSWMDP